MHLASTAKKATLFCFQWRLRASVAWSKQSIRAFGHTPKGERDKREREREESRETRRRNSIPFHFFHNRFPSPRWTKPPVRHSPRQGTAGISRSFVHTERASVACLSLVFSVLSRVFCVGFLDLLAGYQPLINTPFQCLERQYFVSHFFS